MLNISHFKSFLFAPLAGKDPDSDFPAQHLALLLVPALYGILWDVAESGASALA